MSGANYNFDQTDEPDAFVGTDAVMPVLERFLAYRERAVHEVRLYLRRKRLVPDRETEERIIADLIATRLLDDERFARNRAEYRRRNGRGPIQIKSELMGLNVDRSIVGRVLAEQPDAEMRTIALQLLEKRSRRYDPDDPNTPARLKKYLLSRGYSFSLIESAWREFTNREQDTV
ncbi:MAG: RecX family transcriptional regulator [Leptospiraceae bacterium]|nr:RecX family transcriptional regulator [Leptospiraceae bacterium]